MSDPGYRTDVDWTVYTVCGYDHNIVKRSEYTRHHLTNHGGLESERSTHATVCKIASEHEGREKCICRITEYETLAALMNLEKTLQKRISFICSDCGDDFTETLEAFALQPFEEITAPALCIRCGHGAEMEED